MEIRDIRYVKRNGELVLQTRPWPWGEWADVIIENNDEPTNTEETE